MSFQFRAAIRENVALLIGLAGGTGSGKTWSGMAIAKGLSGDKPFAVVDTEAGRAKAYADRFRFDHGDLKPPFSPAAYLEAIRAADDAGYPCILIDSFSHCHAGEGGVLDMAEAELQRMAGDDWKKREACKMASWIKPKHELKKLISRILQVRAHLVICMRAEQKIEMSREDGKTVIRASRVKTGRDGWAPIADKNFPFELTASFLLTSDEPGVPYPIKLPEALKPMFPAGKQIGEESGRLLAGWARGGSSSPASKPAAAPAVQPSLPSGVESMDGTVVSVNEGTVGQQAVWTVNLSGQYADGSNDNWQFKTTNETLGTKAGDLIGAPVTVTYTTTPKGGLMLQTILGP